MNRSLGQHAFSLSGSFNNISGIQFLAILFTWLIYTKGYFSVKGQKVNILGILDQEQNWE